MTTETDKKSPKIHFNPPKLVQSLKCLESMIETSGRLKWKIINRIQSFYKNLRKVMVFQKIYIQDITQDTKDFGQASNDVWFRDCNLIKNTREKTGCCRDENTKMDISSNKNRMICR